MRYGPQSMRTVHRMGRVRDRLASRPPQRSQDHGPAFARFRRWLAAGMLGSVVAGLFAILAPFPARAQDPLTLFASEATPPKHYSDNGVPKGYAIDLAVEAMRRAGFTPTIVTAPWPRAVAQAEAGAGVITGFSRTTERERAFLFSTPLFEDTVILVQRSDAAFDFLTIDSLIGKRIGTARGARYSSDLDQIMNKIDLYEDSNQESRLRMLAEGRIDAAIFPGGRQTVVYTAGKIGLPMTLFTIPFRPISLDANHIGIGRTLPNAAQVLQRLNTAIDGMRLDGTIDAILAKYR